MSKSDVEEALDDVYSGRSFPLKKTGQVLAAEVLRLTAALTRRTEERDAYLDAVKLSDAEVKRLTALPGEGLSEADEVCECDHYRSDHPIVDMDCCSGCDKFRKRVVHANAEKAKEEKK